MPVRLTPWLGLAAAQSGHRLYPAVVDASHRQGDSVCPTMAAPRVIGRRQRPEPTPDLTLDVVLYLGILQFAAVLLMWPF